MTISNLSLPVDIPWRRLCVSGDMIDDKVCDHDFPPRWQSSVAVFAYEPPEDQQTYEGAIVSYLKVVCTVTGYQPDDATEIGVRDRRHYTYFKDPHVAAELIAAAARYYPCYGAILEVSIKPKSDEIGKGKYPYFVDFEPKKRELYELVTETGESLSRSLDEVNIQKGTTTTNGSEVLDSDKQIDLGMLGAMAGGAAGAAAGGVGGAIAGGTIGHKLGSMIGGGGGPKDINQTQKSNLNTTDRSREMREMFSHTTQLAQMYHQFTSYHLGTNRAVFFMLPRPHTVQTEFTFVNGPREMEGIQEVLLVVMRPADVKEFCVEAYLETAHIAHEDTAETLTLTQIVELPLDKKDWYLKIQTGEPEAVLKQLDFPWAIPAGWTLDHFDYKEMPVYGPNATDLAGAGGDTLKKVWIKEITADQITFTALVKPVFDEALKGDWKRLYFATGVLMSMTLRKEDEKDTTTPSDLYLTGRGVCCCPAERPDHAGLKGTAVLAEAPIGTEFKSAFRKSGASIVEANRLRTEIGRQMLKSVNDPFRYPRGAVRFLDTRFVARRISRVLDRRDHPDNHALADIAGLKPEVRARLQPAAGRVRRADLLKMELPELRDRFGLSAEDAAHVRRAALGLEGPPPPPAERWDPPAIIPDVVGMSLAEAAGTLRVHGLATGTLSRRDSDQPTDTVLEQNPAAGQRRAGSRVDLVLATGLSVQIPPVVGKRLSEALCLLRDAGLTSEPELAFEPSREEPRHTVRAVAPQARTYVTPGAKVTLRVSQQ